MSADSKLVLVPRKVGQKVDPNTFYHYRSLSLDELKEEIRKLFQNTNDGVLHTTRAIRSHLLPALMALRERTSYGEWGKFVRSIGLSPATIRQWRHRERHATEQIAYMLGEPEPKRRPGKQEALTESEAKLLAAAGYRLAKAVVAGNNMKYARQLAHEYLHAYRKP